MTGRRKHRVPGRSWQLLEQHYASRNAFAKIYKSYEAKVAGLVKKHNTPRQDLKLNPEQTARLFETPQLEALLEMRVEELRRIANAVFRDNNVSEPYDMEVSKIYHELSILKEEHLSVRDFPRDAGGREFNRLFREVSEYYPQRLRRVRDLFTRAQKRLDVLLPGFNEDDIVLRSAFLYRKDLWPDSSDAGLTRFLGKMFPAEGAAGGFLATARTFLRAGFLEHALNAARMGIAAASKPAKSGESRPSNIRDTVRELDKLVDRAGKELRALEALQEQDA